jgi:hypothetical protein
LKKEAYLIQCQNESINRGITEAAAAAAAAADLSVNRVRMKIKGGALRSAVLRGRRRSKKAY